ncbi:MAG: glycosyltransferase family 9 protein [Patescibacteria group bacterium]|nr:glycosyltransferase family 9 protein [Patescibacteria group bacterium]
MINLKNNPDLKRILIVQFRQIGDVLLSTPFIRIIRQNFPDCRIDFLTEPGPAQIIEGNPNITDIVLFRHRTDHFRAMQFYQSLIKRRYDLVFDLQGTTGTALATFFSRAKYRVGYNVRGRRWSYTIQVQPSKEERYTALNRLALLKEVGITDESWTLDLFLQPEDRESAESFINSLQWKDEFVVAVSPTSRRQTRCWVPERFIATSKMMIEKYRAKVLLLWGPGEKEYVANMADAIGPDAVLIPPTSLRQMAAFIAKAQVLITNNNGQKHLATALGVPTVTIYGSSSDIAWNPPDRLNHRVVKGMIPCIGCHLSVCEHLTCMYLVNEFDIERELLQIPGLQSFLKNSQGD